MVVAGEDRAREKEPSQWREILAAGVDGWSSFSDTCSDRRTLTARREASTSIETSNNNNNIAVVVIRRRNRTRLWFELKQEQRRPVDVWLELRLKELQSLKR